MKLKRWLSALALSSLGLGSVLSGAAYAQVLEEEGVSPEGGEIFETEGQPEILQEGAFEEEGLSLEEMPFEGEMLQQDEYGAYHQRLDWSTQDRGFEGWYGNADEFWF